MSKVKFSKGDKVFAKVRGYPYWPAKIVGPQDENATKIKYDIIFYGTGEKAVVRAEDVQPFLEKRAELGRPKKSKSFNDAMVQIEKDEGDAFSDVLSKDNNSTNEPEISPPIPSTPSPLKAVRKKSVGRPSKQADSTTGNNSPSPPDDVVTIRKRKNNSMTDSEPTPKTVKSSKTKAKDSPTKKNTSPGKKLIIDKIDDEFTFSVDGESYTIILNNHKPSLNCPKNMLDWNRLVMDKASDLKESIKDKTISLEDAQREFDSHIKAKLMEKKREYEENDTEFKLLKVEGKLLQIDVKIKTALTLTHANPDDAIKCLDEVLVLPVTSLMLKKHPEIVDTFKKVTRYIGNLSAWDIHGRERDYFLVQCERLRSKAIQVLEKFKYLFNVADGAKFSRVFSNELRDFSRATYKLSQEEFFSLVKEPNLGPD